MVGGTRAGWRVSHHGTAGGNEWGVLLLVLLPSTAARPWRMTDVASVDGVMRKESGEAQAGLRAVHS